LQGALQLRPIHRRERQLQELQCSHQTHSPHLATKAVASDVGCGRIYFSAALCPLFFSIRLLIWVSVLILGSIQAFYMSKAESVTQVLPWLVVRLLSLGRQSMKAQFRTGMHPIRLCFVKDMVW